MQFSFRSRPGRWVFVAVPVASVLALAGCSGGGGGQDGDASGSFTVMVPQSNEGEIAYEQIFETYSAETGVDVEVIPYGGSDGQAYNTAVTTQLQAGNAADMMIVYPGTGQPVSIQSLGEAGFLEPVGDTASALIPAGTESLYTVDGEIYGQPTSLVPSGLLFNPDAASEVGVDAFPADFDSLISACSTARDGGKSFMVVAGAAPQNTGLLVQIIAATRVYQQIPDWNQQRAENEVSFADSDGWKQTLNDIIEMYSVGCFQDGAAGGTFDSITGGIGSQASLSTAVPGDVATSINQAASLQTVMEAFPPADGQEPFAVASVFYAWGVNAAASDASKQAAKDFLGWVGEADNSTEFATLFGAVPLADGTNSVPATYEPMADLLSNDQYGPLPVSTWPNPAVYDVLGAGVQGLLTGQKTPEQVLQEMDAAWDS